MRRRTHDDEAGMGAAVDVDAVAVDGQHLRLVGLRALTPGGHLGGDERLVARLQRQSIRVAQESARPQRALVVAALGGCAHDSEEFVAHERTVAGLIANRFALN